MKVLGIRYCLVSDDAEALSGFMSDKMALPTENPFDGADSFGGALFPAGDSRVEIWPTGEGMPAMTLMQIVVDDADEWAEKAKACGCEVHGPTDAHGETIYRVVGPGETHITVQSVNPK